MNETLIVALASGVFSLLASGLAVSAAWRKAPADTAAVYQEIASRAGLQISELTDRVNQLQEKLDKLECQAAEKDRMLDEWQVGITRLLMQLESHEMTPVWRPKLITRVEKKNG